MSDTETGREPEYGPCMMALTPKQRKFVLAMASAPLDSAASWARAAGFSDRHDRCKVTAHELFHDDRVQAAVLELAKQTLGTVGPMLAARQLIRIAADPEHKDQLKAISMIANRVGLPEIEQIEIKHTDLTGPALIERVRAVAERLGLDPERLLNDDMSSPKLIEATANEPAAAEAELSPVPDWCGLGRGGVK